MSLFGPILLDAIPEPERIVCNQHYYADALFSKIERNNVELTDEEEDRLKKFYDVAFSGEGLFHLIHLLSSRDGVTVSLSDKEEVINLESIDAPINPYKKKNGQVVVLGKYIKEEDQIILFVNNIRSVAEEFKYECTYYVPNGPNVTETYRLKSCVILAYVLAHELYHAYFYKERYIMRYEEPLAEFGALLYMNNYCHQWYNDKVKEIVIGLRSLVAEKKQSGLECYSRGASLFNKDEKDLIDKYKNCDLSKQQTLDEFETLIYG